MIRWMRSAKIASGKAAQAMQWAKEILEFTKKYEGVAGAEVFYDSFGDVGTLRWCADYDDFAAWEKVSNQVFADAEWWQKMDEASGLFIEGSVKDIVMRSL